jgi:hypothetical protein
MLTQLTVINNMPDPLALNLNGFLKRETMLLPFTWMVPFGKVWCSPLYKMLTDRQYSYYILTPFSVITSVLNSLACINHCFLTRETGLLPFTWRGFFAQRWGSSSRKSLRHRHYSFIHPTQFMMQIEVLDPLTSNIKDSITRATELLLFTSMVPLSTKMVFLT